ncbi:MAG: hypothetical protein IPL96_10285 [Holophagaceae bacterium]|nr:hypothetical protein [Holophagaceae bacterium]
MHSGRLLLLTLGGSLCGGMALGWTAARLSGPFLKEAAVLLGIAALAALLDRGVHAGRKDLPLYRRHLAVFALGLGAAAVAAIQPDGFRVAFLLWGGFGAALALALAVAFHLLGRNLASLAWVRGRNRRPDPSRPLILVADPHWNQRLVGLDAAERLLPGADWLFLGDVFDVWVGLPGMATAAQRDFLAWVADRRAAGAWVGLWMGNREYFLDGLAGHFDLMGEGIGGRLEGETLAFEHGDWINHRDWRYRAWNVVSRSGPVWLLFRLLPGFLTRRIAVWLEAKLRTTNRAYKLAFPREAFAAAAAAAGGVFLTGHFHTLERVGNGLALPWAYDGEFWVWREGRVEPLQPSPPDSTSSVASVP